MPVRDVGRLEYATEWDVIAENRLIFNLLVSIPNISKTARSCYAQPPFPNVVADFLRV